MKTLVVFDFDDTLFYSGAKIGVTKPGESKRYLSSHEYATYSPEEEEEFDYEQFHVYPPDPRPIDRTTKELRSAVFRHGLDNVIILTARSAEEPIMQVLQNFAMPPVEILTMGSANPERKADAVEKLVKEEKYDSVIVYEDSSENIKAIRKRIKPLLGDNFLAFKVKASPKGEVIQQESIMRDLRVSQKALRFFD